jgi:hypothetical protein
MSLTDKILKFSDTIKPIIIVKDDEIDDTSTSLTLCPYNSLNSTNIINTSTLRLMEHFCSPTVPPHSTAGQLWVDTSGAPNEPDRLKVYIPQNPGALVYMDVAGTVISRTGTLRHTGQIKAFNDYNNILKYISGAPSAPPSSTPGTGTVTVTGNPTVGQVLTASVTNLVDPDGISSATYTYYWYSGIVPTWSLVSVGAIPSVPTYTIAPSDVGNNIVVIVSYTDDAGNYNVLGSSFIGPVTAPSSVAPTVLGEPLEVRITGNANIPATLTADISSLTAAGKTVVSYAWANQVAPLSTSPTFTLNSILDATNGDVIGCAVVTSDGNSYFTSRIIYGFASDYYFIEGPFYLDGTSEAGTTLTANTSQIVVRNPIVSLGYPFDGTAGYHYQWEMESPQSPLRIVGTDSPTFTTPLSNDAFAKVRCKLIFAVQGTTANTQVESTSQWVTITPATSLGASPSAVSGLGAITGIPAVGSVLSVSTSGIASTNGMTNVTFAYEWYAGFPGSPKTVIGTNTNTYTVTSTNVGKYISVAISFTDNANNNIVVGSNVVGLVPVIPVVPATSAGSNALALLAYSKFETTKRYCDENYLSGMTEDDTFYVRNDRRIVYTSDVAYTAPLASPDSDEAAFLPRKYIDDNYLNGFNNPDNTFTITDNKPLYYTVDRVPTDLYELVTKKYVYDVNATLVQAYSSQFQALLDRLNLAFAKVSTARDSAEAAYRAFLALPSPTATTPIDGGTILREDISLPTVDSYSGVNTSPTLSGTITTLPALTAGATYEVKVDGILATGVVISGFRWSLDSTSYAWTAPSTHTILVKRTETSGTSYESVGASQINITALPVPQVPTISPAAGTTTLPIEVPDIEDIQISGTVGTTVLGTGEQFNVTVKKVGAAVGLIIPSTSLVVTGTTWTLALPSLALGTTYDVTATRTDAAGVATSDTTSGELVVTTPANVAPPTLTPMVTSRKWPVIKGTVGTIPITAGQDFKVKINNIDYTAVLDSTRLNWSVTLDRNEITQKLPLGAINVIVKRFGKQSTERIINVVDYLRVYNPDSMRGAAYMNYSLKFLEEDLKVGYYMYEVPDALKVKITNNGVTTIVAQTEKPTGTYSKVSYGYPSDVTVVWTQAKARKNMHYFTINKDLINDDAVLGIYINEGDATGRQTQFEYVLQVAGDLQPIEGKVLKEGKLASNPDNWVPLVLGTYTINLDGSVTSL